MSRIHTAIVLIAAGLLLAACHGNPPPSANGPPQPLQSIDIAPGDGAQIASGQVAVVDYTGWLYEQGAADHKGRVFDSSQSAGAPFRFRLGAGEVIRGWDQGVAGMRVHGRRRLTIPPDLAYGADGAGPIPGGATLVFDVELVAIE